MKQFLFCCYTTYRFFISQTVLSFKDTYSFFNLLYHHFHCHTCQFCTPVCVLLIFLPAYLGQLLTLEVDTIKIFRSMYHIRCDGNMTILIFHFLIFFLSLLLIASRSTCSKFFTLYCINIHKRITSPLFLLMVHYWSEMEDQVT